MADVALNERLESRTTLMRYLSTVVLMLLISAAPLFAQKSHGPPTPTPIPAGSRPVPRPLTASLSPIQLEDQWTTALVRRDARTFDQLLAPNFVYTENAAVMGRSDVIKSVSGPDRVDWARNEGMRVHDFGDVQVITGVLHLKGRGRQGLFDRRYQFTDTWQRRNGRWQIIAAQDYLIPGVVSRI
jgi:ketosteroid isomerase-like protein